MLALRSIALTRGSVRLRLAFSRTDPYDILVRPYVFRPCVHQIKHGLFLHVFLDKSYRLLLPFQEFP